MNGPGIPESWAVVPIRELLAPLDGGRLLDHGWSPQCDKEPSRTHDEWGVLKTTSIQPGAFCDVHNKRLPTKLAPRTHLEVRSGDLLLTCAGPRARCGVACLVRETRPRLMLSGKMYRFRARQELLDSRYLEAFLLANATQVAIDRMKTGISDSGLNLTHERFMSLPVVLAPVREQHRIVEVIESYFTRLDDAVATLERVQRNLKRYRASVLKAAVEGRLVPTEAELARAEGRSYEPASVLLERILAERRRRWEEAELAKMKANGKEPKDDKWKARYRCPEPINVMDLPELPEGWIWTSVDAIGDVLLGRQRAPQFLTGRNLRPYLRVANIKDDRIDFSDLEEMDFDQEHFQKYRLDPADILVSEGQSPELLGQSAIYAGEIEGLCFQKTLHRFRPVQHGPSSAFAQVVFRSHVKSGLFRQLGSITTNIGHLTLTKFKGAPFPLPPAREQERITRELSRIMSIVDGLAASNRVHIAKCSRLRQSILKWAFKGRLVDQDLTDEPASRLLERIRAERESTSESPARRTRRAKASTAKS